MGPVKKDLYLCVDLPELESCILQEMIDVAVTLGEKIGVAMRVDMFVADGKFYVQEYSANHMNGLRHCAAKLDDNGCIDSCFLGRHWNEAGAPYGGSVTPVPDEIDGYTGLTAAQQCALLQGKAAPSYQSQC
jgi:hypothetical protein